MISDLNGATHEGRTENALGQIISGLIGYAETHFKTGEKYFEQFGYPDIENHIREHASFVNHISKIIDKLVVTKQTNSANGKLLLNENFLYLKKYNIL